MALALAWLKGSISIKMCLTWNFAISVFGGIWVLPGTSEDEFIELKSELLLDEFGIPSDEPLHTESRLDTADEQDSDSNPKKRDEIGFFGPGCEHSREGRFGCGGSSEKRQGSGLLLLLWLLLLGVVGAGMFRSWRSKDFCWNDVDGMARVGFGGKLGRFCGVLSAELEQDPDPPVSFSSCKNGDGFTFRYNKRWGPFHKV